MATTSKAAGGLMMLGFVFAATGIVFLIVGRTAIGCAMLGVGLGWTIGGLVRARKAASPAVPTGTPPPPESSSARS